jgi:hypothetical protein
MEAFVQAQAAVEIMFPRDRVMGDIVLAYSIRQTHLRSRQAVVFVSQEVMI